MVFRHGGGAGKEKERGIKGEGEKGVCGDAALEDNGAYPGPRPFEVGFVASLVSAGVCRAPEHPRTLLSAAAFPSSTPTRRWGKQIYPLFPWRPEEDWHSIQVAPFAGRTLGRTMAICLGDGAKGRKAKRNHCLDPGTRGEGREKTALCSTTLPQLSMTVPQTQHHYSLLLA